jgi:hypothetical protein
MIASMQFPLVAGYVGLWIVAVYGGGWLPSLNEGAAKAVGIALVVTAHVLIGALLRTWWACALALVPPLVAPPGTDDWPLLLLYAPPAALLIAGGVAATRARSAGP